MATDRLTEVPMPAQYVVDDLPYLWFAREVLARGPNARLIDLGRHDERLAAYLDALRVHRMSIMSAVREEFERGGPAAEFALVYLSAITGDLASVVAIAENATKPPNIRPMVAALAWAERDVAVGAIDELGRSSAPRARAISIAAFGARRSGPSDRLDTALAHASPLVRARAYRTAGQLGRADLVAQIRPGLTDGDSECRFWSAWAAARMGAGGEALDVLADIAWNKDPRAVRALDLLLRRLDVPQANAWLREFAKLPNRQRDLIRAAGVIGDPLYIPWLIERMLALETTRLAGEAFSMITGLDLAYRDLDRKPPQDFESGPNDDPADENVSLDDDEHLPWPDPEKIGQWWTANRGRFNVGTPYFLGAPKPAADLLQALSDAFQRQRHAAALELAIRQPDKAMFEVRARGRLQRQLLAGASGKFGR
jgi:uncharacterized protein (TIGR02270 family)